MEAIYNYIKRLWVPERKKQIECVRRTKNKKVDYIN